MLDSRWPGGWQQGAGIPKGAAPTTCNWCEHDRCAKEQHTDFLAPAPPPSLPPQGAVRLALQNAGNKDTGYGIKVRPFVAAIAKTRDAIDCKKFTKQASTGGTRCACGIN